MTVERQLIRDLAATLRAQVAGLVVKDLEEMLEGLSDDSGLANVWEEFCVQVQGEHSFFWETYLEIVEDFVVGHIDELPLAMQRVLSMGTDVGDGWLDDPEEGGVVPIFADDVAVMLSSDVLALAADFESPSIERYKARGYEGD
ncbi:hypothetical protein UU9_10512 [Rhodanobacter fulvus Jip2]|uniref:Uncharacterized protein n=1 Tax=Rhodanobacter fulvus Jip2 TaxID=1163408 RepID=I4VPD0_9GAMM|nr:hypothetical protein [Rhodanobacter fulvus]EIL89071.1 hypothetical protein UU9_10512 [Rhodanobacter fulvus Jip2]